MGVEAQGAGSGGLLYEAGNWGDLLKGEWVLTVAAWLMSLPQSGALEYLDPFAGSPTYPLGRSSRARLQEMSDTLLGQASQPYCDDDLWPSAATLVRSMGGGQGKVDLRVFDAEEERRNLYLGDAMIEVLDLFEGWAALTGSLPGPRGLVLVDPYDFLREWREQLEVVVAAAEETTLLVYIYNRSARDARLLREYRDFRNRLDDLRGDRSKLLCRIAADAFLPTAHHEMLFLPSPAVEADSGFEKLCSALGSAALSIRDILRRRETIQR